MVKKLIPLTEDILAAGHMGCIVRVAELLARLEMKPQQKAFLNTLKQSLHIPSEDEETVEKTLAKLIVSLMTYDMFYKVEENSAVTSQDPPRKEEETTAGSTTVEMANVELQKHCINYHGTCLLKSCLEFEKCRIVVNSILKLTPQELVLVACHPSGSFAFESLLANQWIKLKQKNKLAEKLRKRISDLARDKFGSRVVDSLWGSVSPDAQSNIKEELIKNKERLTSDMYGRIVLSNCGIDRPMPRKKEFMERQEKKRPFESFIHPGNKTQAAMETSFESLPPFKKKKQDESNNNVMNNQEQQQQTAAEKKKKKESEYIKILFCTREFKKCVCSDLTIS